MLEWAPYQVLDGETTILQRHHCTNDAHPSSIESKLVPPVRPALSEIGPKNAPPRGRLLKRMFSLKPRLRLVLTKTQPDRNIPPAAQRTLPTVRRQRPSP